MRKNKLQVIGLMLDDYNGRMNIKNAVRKMLFEERISITLVKRAVARRYGSYLARCYFKEVVQRVKQTRKRRWRQLLRLQKRKEN